MASIAPWQIAAIAYFLQCIGFMPDGCNFGLVGSCEVYPRVLRRHLQSVSGCSPSDPNHQRQLKYLIPYVEAMNAHIVEMVYVCRRSNFDTFKVPSPELKPKGKARNNSEYHQYMDLKDTVTKIWQAKCTTNDNRSSYPDPAIIIRHVTYEQTDRDRPLTKY